MVAFDRNPQDFKYLRLLSRQFPTEQSAFTEIINLSAILNLPKGTEHFMSDVHGEYEAFMHILNNCSGVVREHVDEIFGDTLTFDEKGELCTLIYYPREKIELVRSQHEDSPTWYKTMLDQLIVVARSLSSRYTRSKVRKAIPRDYAYIIDELLHTHPDENNYRVRYHERIIESILETASADDFIESLASLIKRLAVDHLHLVGDIFDRGGGAAKIMDRLLTYHSLDIQWGNHDLLWMGAAAGEPACIATVLRNNLRYDNYEILENDYGISLRELVAFADATYTAGEPITPLIKAINVLLFKLEGRLSSVTPSSTWPTVCCSTKLTTTPARSRSPTAACGRSRPTTSPLSTRRTPTRSRPRSNTSSTSSCPSLSPPITCIAISISSTPTARCTRSPTAICCSMAACRSTRMVPLAA